MGRGGRREGREERGGGGVLMEPTGKPSLSWGEKSSRGGGRGEAVGELIGQRRRFSLGRGDWSGRSREHAVNYCDYDD